MSPTFTVYLNTARSILHGQPRAWQLAEAKRSVKLFVLPRDHVAPMVDVDVPDHLVSDQMAERYIDLTPPAASVIPECQVIINEIERAYVLGLYFSTVSAACVAIERMLNLARIELHTFHPKIKSLWQKGPSNSWTENIDALQEWRYLDEPFADELRDLYSNVRCRYLHSGPVEPLNGDALRAAKAAYKLLGLFLGFPRDLFRWTSHIECLNTSDPRFVAFYRSHGQDDSKVSREGGENAT